MPWKISQQGGRHCVVKADSGTVVKCHDDEESAKAHLAALYANYTKSNGRTRPSILDPISPGYNSSTAKSMDMNNCSKPKVEYSKKAKKKIAEAQDRYRKSLTEPERKSLAEGISVLSEDKDFLKGGAGSGNFGHRGRPGAIGGSGGGTGPIASGAKVKIGESAGNFLAGEVGHVISGNGDKVKIKLAADESVIDILRADVAGVTYREVGDHMVNENDGSLEKTQAEFDAADAAANMAAEDVYQAQREKDRGRVGQALEDWRSGRAYIDNAGNYRVKNEGSSNGPIAPWNKEAKRTFANVSALHKAALDPTWKEKQGGGADMAAEDAYLAQRERARGR